MLAEFSILVYCQAQWLVLVFLVLSDPTVFKFIEMLKHVIKATLSIFLWILTENTFKIERTTMNSLNLYPSVCTATRFNTLDIYRSLKRTEIIQRADTYICVFKHKLKKYSLLRFIFRH